MKAKLTTLEKKFQYTFQNQDLFKQALTHRSMHADHNERLEFLGDSILNFVIGNALYHKMPKAKEGDLSRYRAQLVCEDSLAAIAVELNLSDFLILGPGELRAGGFRRKSILADALEAIIAAVYLDSQDFLVAQQLVLRWFEERLKNVKQTKAKKDPKSALQEYLQSKKLPLPTYKISKTTGADHNQTFHIECIVKGVDAVAHGEGATRRTAEQAAATAFLKSVFQVEI